MLVLGIREGEAIDVNGPCRISMVRYGQVSRLGFEAPDSTRILRAGLIQREEHEVERIRQEHMEEAASE